MTHRHTHAKKKSKSIIPGFGLSFGIVMAILGIIVVIPLCSLVVFSARLSLSEFWQTITRPRVLSSYAVKSILLTLKVVVITVVVNTIFGLYAAWLITKFTFRGKKIISTLIDLPLTISPIIAGLIFVLTFGRQSFLYPYLEKLGIQIIFAVPGIVLATIFVTFPFISREIIPVLTAAGNDEEEAAALMGANGFQRSHSPTYAGLCCTELYCAPQGPWVNLELCQFSRDISEDSPTPCHSISSCCTRHLTSQEPLPCRPYWSSWQSSY